ncbi:DUF3150 domain-containing protein [Desulfovibrio sp.]|uniref:DUF3150 domain-containing protein n=1 Tax=Desulfovibrio sp. TaxID=885 RepID=UPI0035B1D76B
MTQLVSDIRILDNLLALNLNVSLWSARRKMSQEDLGGAELPPEDLASLGSKRIADPENLKVFGTLKARAFNYLDRHGVRFMSGWAIPEERAGEIVQELLNIRTEFQKEKKAFLANYDQNVQAWIEKHHQWGEIIRNSLVGPDYVRARMDFRWQLYKVAPLEQHTDNTAVLEAGLAEEVQGLGGTLFDEVAKSADDIWRRVYHGKTEVTHKALSPLRTLHAKLTGLSFVEPHVAPVADIVQSALLRMPKKGNITGTDLLLLQGLVCLLKDSTALVGHAQKVIEGYGPAFVLDALLAGRGVRAVSVMPWNCPAAVSPKAAAGRNRNYTASNVISSQACRRCPMVFEELPSLFRIEVPLPGNPLKQLNAYLIKGDDRHLLVDNGFNMAECEHALRSALQELDAPLEKLDFFLTHLHSDHNGLTSVLRTPEARIFCSAEDGNHINRFIEDDAAWTNMMRGLEKHGFSGSALEELLQSHPGKIYASPEPLPFTPVNDGQVIAYGGYTFTVIAVPGHNGCDFNQP